VVIANGVVKAVGVAEMPGEDMERLSRGIAVKIRHKVK
jgi:predicted RNA-binding protein